MRAAPSTRITSGPSLLGRCLVDEGERPNWEAAEAPYLRRYGKESEAGATRLDGVLAEANASSARPEPSAEVVELSA